MKLLFLDKVLKFLITSKLTHIDFQGKLTSSMKITLFQLVILFEMTKALHTSYI